MARSSIGIAIAVVALSMSGCIGDRAADRTLEIHQVQSTNSYTGQFRIDMSQIPPDAIKTEVKNNNSGSPVTSLTIDSEYPIRILIVPATKTQKAP
jgi:hypothetical protein